MIICDDILNWAATYDGPKFHAILTDPPYELGFMNRKWDKTGISFQPETWATLAQHLYPGAFGMAFASSRGWHRMAVAIEDAGLIIHPTIFAWAFATGFPKTTRLDPAIDRMAGAERTVTGEKPQQGAKFKATQEAIDNGGFNDPNRASYPISEPATELARDWAGHRYGLQALKPAIEPIIVFQKPYQGKPVQSIVETGAGALWVEGARINGFMDGHWGGRQQRSIGYGGTEIKGYQTKRPAGRWPANFCLVHHPDCVDGTCVDGCPVRLLGEQSGESVARPRKSVPNGHRADGIRFNKSIFFTSSSPLHDSGTAARYFHQSDWSYEVAEQLANADPVKYQAKASQSERNAGLEERNVHPTLKPIALTKWLATLLLPPVRYGPRRIMVPFAGVGSEMIGALQAGWEDVVGIELGAEYVAIAERRIKYWAATSQLPIPLFDQVKDTTNAAE